MKYFLLILITICSFTSKAQQYIVSTAGNPMLIGLSTDSKPTPATDNWKFLEINTGKLYTALSGSWVLSVTPVKTSDTAAMLANLLAQSNTNTAAIATKVSSTAAGLTMLLASATSVSGAALATTNLTFASGVALSTHSPVFAVVKFVSGTLGIGVIRIKTGTSYLVAATAMVGLTSGDNNYIMQLTGSVTASGNVSVEVTTASLAPSAFSVYVYGIAKP